MTTSTTDGAKSGVSVTGRCTLQASGTFAGANLLIQTSATDGNYGNARDAKSESLVFKGVGGVNLEIVGTQYVRVVQSGSTATTSVAIIATQ